MEVGNMSIQGIDKSNTLDITQLQESQNIKNANTDFKYMKDIIQSGNGQKDNIVISEGTHYWKCNKKENPKLTKKHTN
jgi:hypothetical protein